MLERIVGDLYLVPGYPFIFIRGTGTLLLSDTHFGFEEAAARGLDYSLRGKSGYAGIFLPRIQFKRVVQMLGEVVPQLRPARIIVNGDLKHAFDRLLRQEKEEVEGFARKVRELGVEELVVIRGNHDNFVAGLLERLDVPMYTSIETSVDGLRTLITHGHAEADTSGYDLVIMGHEHPSARCFGSRSPALLVVPLRTGGELVVLPASGPYHPGTSASDSPADYLSPLLRKNAVLPNMKIYTWIPLEGPIAQAPISYEGPVTIREHEAFGRRTAIVVFDDFPTYRAVCVE
ncbi:MAG: metallophosphoesterase [Desulfurococcaceae archaeon]